MKKTIFTLLSIASVLFTHAQLGYTKQEVIKKNGYDYEEKTTDGGMPYLQYKKSMRTDASGSYTNFKCYYFNKSGICIEVLIIEPASEINSWVVYFNSKFVKTGDLSWKDYETNSVMKLSIEDFTTGRSVSVIYEYDK